MLSALKNVLNFLINTNLFVAFCVFSLTMASSILTKSTNFQLAIFVFFATIFTYNIQRLISVRLGAQHITKYFINQHFYLIILIILITGFISLYYLFNFQLKTQALLFVSAIISLLYPIFLRKIPFLKIFLISFVWTVITYFLLVIENDLVINSSVFFHFVSRYLFVFSITIPFDIRDINIDIGKIKTIPNVYGEKKSQVISICSLTVSFFIFLYFYTNNQINLSSLLSLALTFVLACVLILKSTTKKNELFFKFGIESISIFFYAILFISSCVI